MFSGEPLVLTHLCYLLECCEDITGAGGVFASVKPRTKLTDWT